LATWLLVPLQLACHAHGGAADGGGDGGAHPVPVLTSRVEKRDMPIRLEGLGTVAAYYTVTIHSRVDGELMKVAFLEGQQVKKGDLLAQIDPRPFQIAKEQAEAQLARDKASLVDDKLNLDRDADLRKQALVSQQVVDDQQALVGQFEGSVKADQAAVDSANLNLVYSRIVSPIDGLTGVRLIDPGNIIHAADTNGLVVITALDPIAVLFTLPEDDLPAISEQMENHKLTADAFTRDGRVNLGTGEVALVDNQINQTTGTLRIKAIFPNPHRALWPNQFVKTSLLLDTRKNALVIPTVAVQRGQQGTFVYRVKSDSTVEARPLTLGPSHDDLTVAESGLNEGDVVVVDGQYKLHVGSLVTARDVTDRKDGASDGGGSVGGAFGGAQ
jgi:multidrug efflux system membrane fusion protein